MKTCIKCGDTKPLDAFQKHRTARDGHRNVCRDCNCQRMRERDARMRPYTRAQRKAFYAENRERIIQERRDFRAGETERINARRREQRKQDPERFRALQRASYVRNRERVLAREKARNFRRRQIDTAMLLERDRGFCGICGSLIDLDDFHIDHITPRILGGSNDYENLQLAHPFCNQSKRDQLLTAPRSVTEDSAAA